MQQFAEGLNLKGCKAYLGCAVCKSSFPVSKSSTRQTTRVLELVHEDLMGQCKRSKVLVIVDDYSRFGFCYLLKSKIEVIQKFKQWVSFVERRYKQQ
ncbi:hypothetical protein E2320_004992, partial [Naja naja]